MRASALKRSADTRGGTLTQVQRPLVLQRACDCGRQTGGGECDTCKQKSLSLQRHANGSVEASVAPAIVQDVLRSPGQSIDPVMRTSMESRFRQDFSRVRVHTGSSAAESARAVDALAYTVGNNIVFGADQYPPRSNADRQLLAHELAHTLQQRSYVTSSLSHPLGITDPTDVAEHDADQAARRAMQGEPTQVAGADGIQLARETATGTPSKTDSSTNESKKEPPKRPDLQPVVGIHRSGFGVFDAELDRRLAKRNQPCRLTLRVNVKFTPQGPWPPGSFAKWQSDLIRIVTNRWSFRFLLAPDRPCADEPCKSATAILQIVPVTTSASNVHNVTVNYLKPPGTRSSSGTLHAADVRTPGTDLRRGQTTVSHEAGHWLGLNHIHCNTNADECYGTTDEESADVMGRGEIVSERDYVPFAEAISAITKCSWRPVGHADTALFGSSWIAPLAILGGLAGAVGGAVLGASQGLGAAIGIGAALGVSGALAGGAIGAGLNEVAR